MVLSRVKHHNQCSSILNLLSSIKAFESLGAAFADMLIPYVKTARVAGALACGSGRFRP
jgi:hypothetical protein